MPEEVKIVIPSNPVPSNPVPGGDPNPTPTPALNTDFGEVELDGAKYKLDKDGNALNDKGEVFKSKTDIETLSSQSDEAEQIEIDGVVLKIDKEGNAIDDNNAIIYTKEQLAKFEEVSDSGTLDVSKVIKAASIPIYDNNGEEVIYDNTEKGLTNYITDVRQTSYQEGQIAYQNALLNRFPIINDILTHLELHGSLKDFSELPDYSKVTIDKNNVSQQESIILQARGLRGDSPEKARDYIQYLKDGKRLEEEANSELAYLNQHYAKLRTDKQKQLDDRQQIDLRKQTEYWGVEVKNGQLHPINKSGSVYDLVKKGTIKVGEDTYTIPEKIKYTRDGKVGFASREDFFNYLYVPYEFNTPNGKVSMTLYDYDLEMQNQSRTIDHDIFDALKTFAGNDMSQIIKQAIKDEEVRKIRKLKSSNSPEEHIKGKPELRKIVIKR